MRDAFSEQLEAIRTDLVAVAQLVRTAVTRATSALLEADSVLAEEVITADAAVDALCLKIEDDTFELMALQSPVASDLRMLVSTLRMVTEFGRMGDLAVHIAKIARLRTPEVAVPSDLVPIIARMAAVAEVMVGKIEYVIANSDVAAAAEFEQVDDEMDKLRRKSFREILGTNWTHGVEPAIDIALLGRYYERIADHAVSIAHRVIFFVTGEPVASSPVR